MVCKCNEARFNYSQKYIFNYIVDLFGKDTADNFIVLFTFCNVGKIISKQCFYEKNSAFHEIINIKKNFGILNLIIQAFFQKIKIIFQLNSLIWEKNPLQNCSIS